MRSTANGYWSEVFGSLDEVVADILLTTPAHTLVTIVEGDPDDPDRTLHVVVPPWGQA
mgnify:CR=1 FL=1